MRVSETIFRSPQRVQQRDHRVEVGDRVDLAGAHRRDRAAAGADADDRDVARLQADLGEHEVGEHVGRRARRGDAELLALELGHRLEVRHRLRIDAEDDLRRPALQHEGAQPLALDLHVDGVLERARDDVGAAADHRLQRARAAGEIGDRDVEAFGLEVAQALGDRQRQVVQQVLAADGDRQLRLLDRLARGRRGRRRGWRPGRGRGLDEAAALHAMSPGFSRRRRACAEAPATLAARFSRAPVPYPPRRIDRR